MRICRTTRSCTASRQGLWGRSAWGGCLATSLGDPVAGKEAKGPIQPRSAPPLPAEPVTLARARQVGPNLLFHPVSDVRETPAGVAGRKVLHPAAQHRIDAGNHLCDGPGPMTSKHGLERPQQRRPLLALWRAPRHPSAATTANPTELKAEKSEVL